MQQRPFETAFVSTVYGLAEFLAISLFLAAISVAIVLYATSDLPV